VSVLLGSEAIASTYFGLNASRSSFYSDNVNYMYLNAGEKDQTNYGDGSESKTASYFGRLNYDYMGNISWKFRSVVMVPPCLVPMTAGVISLLLLLDGESPKRALWLVPRNGWIISKSVVAMVFPVTMH